EAEMQARLQHPHVVQVFDVGEAAGGPYVALEFIDGISLDKQLAGTPQPARAAAQLVETLARAMHYAHQRGLVHRDLKPANSLLAFSREPPARRASGLAGGSRLNEATPKITDFGLAKRLDVEASQTQSGAILGTPSYMALEQAWGQTQAIAPVTDVYALGA